MFLLNKVIGAGGAVPDSIYTAPARIQAVECPSLDDGTILLTDPRNLIVVNTYSVQKMCIRDRPMISPKPEVHSLCRRRNICRKKSLPLW